jgi:hypothetical protein
MGLFKKLGKAAGVVSPKLMEHGLLGRGTIAEIDESSLGYGGGEDDPAAIPVVNFTIEVALDHTEPYVARCRQAISRSALEQLVPHQKFVAVRVNPDDHQEIAIDADEEPPIVTLPAAGPNDLTAVKILGVGVPARVTIEASAFLGLRNADGLDMHAFKTTVTPDGKPSCDVQFSNPVPGDAAALIKDGAELPAKVLADNPNAVAIDWAAAK